MTSKKTDEIFTDTNTNGLINLYKQAIKNAPLLKFSWIIIATICILSLAAYFKLNNAEVFYYTLIVIIISFLGFLFSYLLNTSEKFIKILLYILLTTIVTTLGISVLGFGTFIIWEKPHFYSRWFPNNTDTSKSKSINDTTKIKDTSSKIEIRDTIKSDKTTITSFEDKPFEKIVLIEEKYTQAGTWNYFIDTLIYVGTDYMGKEIGITFSGVFYDKEPHDADGMNWTIGFYCNGYPINNTDMQPIFASITHNLTCVASINPIDYKEKVVVGSDGNIRFGIKLISTILVRNGRETRLGKEAKIFMKDKFTVKLIYPF